MTRQQIMFEFGQAPSELVGVVEMMKTPVVSPKDLHEYVIAPAAQWNEETKQFDVIGWGLVHRTHIHPEYAKAMPEREARAES